MYADTILFILGGFFALLAVGLVVYLAAFRKRSRVYAETLRQETESFNALTSTSAFTVSQTQNKTAATGENATAGGAGGFDPSVVAEFYDIEYEIGGGAMSRTFVVRNKKLGNLWFLKFVSSKYGKLASEEHILKLLNHVSLPKIIDVFYREEGTYLIETLVEGIALDELCGTEFKPTQYVVLDWFEQIAQALNYLHNIKPAAVFHLDLKPGNIMATHDNRLVLVDFGISRKDGSGGASAITVKYAAPEQFGRVAAKYANVLEERFGDLPAGHEAWGTDARTDIFSLGVIIYELATGRQPTHKNLNDLGNFLSPELTAIVQKCLHVNPAQRYKNAADLLNDLRKQKGAKIKMARSLLVRRFAAAAAVFCLVASVATLAWGYNVFATETSATISSHPDAIIVSLQQSSVFYINREMLNGDIIPLDGSAIRWEHGNDNIARVEGNRVTGLNVGTTYITGRHRNGEVTLEVRVVEPINVDGMVEISQRFQTGRSVSVFNAPAFGELFSPESITANADGDIYFTSAGTIRSTAETIPLPREYAFITADMVRHNGQDLFILTPPWVNLEGREVFSIVRVRDIVAGNIDEAYGSNILGNTHTALEFILTADARHVAIEDFSFCQCGRLYFIERNVGVGSVFLRSLHPDNLDAPDSPLTHYRLPEGSTNKIVANCDVLYIGNSLTGVIYKFTVEGTGTVASNNSPIESPYTEAFDNNSIGELRNFAGIAEERSFIDGVSPRFFMPQRMYYRDGFLYVWDFNTLRRIEAHGGVAGETITIAGMASPVYERELSDLTASFRAEDIIFPHGRLMDFVVTDDGIFITDHKRGVIWVVVVDDYSHSIVPVGLGVIS